MKQDLKLATLMFNCGYALGHHDTVESQYIDLVEADMYTYHDEVVKVLLDSQTKMSHPATLPRCKHGSALSDWSGEWLAPPCGCNFDNTTAQNQKDMAFLKLK